VSICITMSIYKIDREGEVKWSWKTPFLFILIACGLPVVNFIVWSALKTKFEYDHDSILIS
jgi:hypothetical protein